MTDAEVIRDIQIIIDEYAVSESPGSCSEAIEAISRIKEVLDGE